MVKLALVSIFKKLKFPTQVNIKCLILTIAAYIFYVLCTLMNQDWKAALSVSISSIPLSLLAVYLYQRWYNCKKKKYSPESWLASSSYSLVIATIPSMAWVMRESVNSIPKTKWRKKQVTNTTRFLTVPFIYGLVLYILMNRFDKLADCEYKMKPTAVSAPTAVFKTKGYRKHLEEPYHLRRFLFWSILIYVLVFSISYGISAGVKIHK